MKKERIALVVTALLIVWLHIAPAPASVSWSVETTAPASQFRDQYCARAGQGHLRLALLQILAAVTQNLKTAVSKPNRFRLAYVSLSGADQLAKGIGKRVNWHGFPVGRSMPTADGLAVSPPLGVT